MLSTFAITNRTRI